MLQVAPPDPLVLVTQAGREKEQKVCDVLENLQSEPSPQLRPHKYLSTPEALTHLCHGHEAGLLITMVCALQPSAMLRSHNTNIGIALPSPHS